MKFFKRKKDTQPYEVRKNTNVIIPKPISTVKIPGTYEDFLEAIQRDANE